MFASAAASGLRRPSIAEVDTAVRAKLGMTKSTSKAQPVVFNRQIAMYLAHRLGGWSTIRIGKFYNGRDHSTVCHAIKRVETLRRCSTQLERLLTGLTEDIIQIRRSGDRPLPLTVQREIQCVEQIAWTDAVLDALAERIARRIQVALVSGRGEICGT